MRQCFPQRGLCVQAPQKEGENIKLRTSSALTLLCDPSCWGKNTRLEDDVCFSTNFAYLGNIQQHFLLAVSPTAVVYGTYLYFQQSPITC